MKYFLGMKISRADKGIFLNQQKFIFDLLLEIEMSKANEVDTPSEPNRKLSCNEGI